MFWGVSSHSQYLWGVTASSLHEARLGYEEFGKEVHVYAPAYKEAEFEELLTYSNHIIFNSFAPMEPVQTLTCSGRANASPAACA